MISQATASLVVTRLQGAPWLVKSEAMHAALTARDDDHFWELLNVRADPDIVKVGPKGYIHGWIFVGAPGVGAEVFHPHHGKGVVTGHDGKHATVKFANGKTQSFEAREGEGKGKLVERAKQPTSGSTEGTRGATRERMEREKQITAEQRAKWGAHNANAVVTDSNRIKGLSDEDLRGVDKELTRRATAIGRHGEVGKVHQKVKDELARRGAGGKLGGVKEKENTKEPSARKPRSGGKPTLGALEADAKAKEAAAVQSKDPADMRAAAMAWRAHAAATKNPGTKELSTNRADAIERIAGNRENEMRMDDVVKDPSSVKDLSDAHLTQVNHDLNSRELAPGSKSTEGHAEASAAVKAELARRQLPVEQASDRLGPAARSSKYPETVPKMTDAELAQADKEHADLTRRAGGGNAVIGEGHKAVRAEMARRQEAIANRPENRRKAYEAAKGRAKSAEFGTNGLDRSGASHDRAAAAHDRAAQLAVTDRQRAAHEAKAAEFREQAKNLREGKNTDTGGREMTADELSKKAQRTGTAQDHLAAFRAQQAAGNRSKVNDHRKALEQLDNADEAEEDAQIHADAAAHTHDPDAHKAAADAYDEAADHLDGVPGARKREAALRAKAQGHRDQAADIEKKTADYVQAFTTANRTTHAADRSGKASAHREAAAAQRKAAARAMTVPQRRHHEAEAARHERAAQRAS